MTSFGRKVFLGAVVISAFTLLSRLSGFIQKLVIAHQFGTGFDADAYTFAFSSVVFTFMIVPHKLLAPFLPLFAERREKEGEPAAWRFTGAVASVVTVVTMLAVVLGIVFAPWLVRVLSSFHSAETAALATTLVRIMLPAAGFTALFALGTLIFNADKRFALPAFADAANKILVIGVMLALCPFLGIKGLALGVVAGAAVCLAVLVIGLRSKLGMVRLAVDWKDPSLKKLAWLVPPTLASILTAQARTMIDYRFASGMGQGYASSLGYAKSLTDTLIMLVPFAVGVVIYPFFSDLTVVGDRRKTADAVMGSLRTMAFLFVPISVALMVLRVPVVQLAFQRGRFEMSSVLLTAGPLLFFAAALTALALEIILMRFYFASQDTLTPAIVGVACVVVHVGLVVTFKDTMEHRSIALAAAVSKSLKVVILYFLLKSKLGDLRLGENLVFGLKTLTAAGGMALAVYLVDREALHLLPASAGMGKLAATGLLAFRLGAASAAGFIVFGGIAMALRVREMHLLWTFARQKLGR
jgi:putative peptidoglycan lipid II flippase